MGLCDSKEEDKGEAKIVNKIIEKQIVQDERATKLQVKLLLLGPGESGKSTVLKQMRIIHDNGFTEAEMLSRASAVYSNTVQSMAMLLQGMQKLHLRLESVEREADARVVLDVVESETDSEPFTREFFLDSIDRINAKNFVPTTQDVLMTRVPTIGVSEVDFKMKELLFRVFDVGGQKSERRKWIHCFDNVNAIIFIVAISEYDQTLREDAETNRMVDSMQLFRDICNNQFFIQTSMILFLNKKDLFEEKIARVSIKVAFPEYDGPSTFDATSDYIQQKFENLNANEEEKSIYVHLTCATDTNQVQLVLESVIDMLVGQNLRGTGVV
uniref:Uncharacterized protein n=1 Tax=Plectus sambesii TaxID=2011161 RepID=A0A914XGS7_9BILA